MRIAFVDRVAWPYDADTPYDEPLGGTHSAACYLAVELARLGPEVTIFNGVAAPQIAFIGAPYLWLARAREWAAWLSELAGR